MTNLDRIKRMNAEEFIEFVGADSICQAIRWHDCEHCYWHEVNSDCNTCIKKWLTKDVNCDD